MRGGVQRKGNRWYAYVSINGIKKSVKGSGSDTKKEAEKKLNQAVAEIDNGTYWEIKKVRFKDFAKEWVETYAKMKTKPSTLQSCQDIINKRLVPLFGDYFLHQVSATMMQGFVTERIANVKGKTVRNEVVVLKLIYKRAFKNRYIRVNPAEYIDLPKIERTEMEIWSPEEVRLFLAHVTAKHRVFFLTAILTGMRRGELLALQKDDIDWKNKQIHVRRSVWRGQFIAPKTSYSVRRIDVSPYLLSELRRHVLASPSNDLGLVFANEHGGILDPDTLVKRHFFSAIERAKIKRIRFHDLRHTNASLRIAEGQNPKYIQDQMGHASIQTTFDRYGHLLKKANPDQAKKLDGILGFDR
jgi:integrase